MIRRRDVGLGNSMIRQILMSLLIGTLLTFAVCYVAAVNHWPGKLVTDVKKADDLSSRIRERLHTNEKVFSCAGTRSFGRVYMEYMPMKDHYVTPQGTVFKQDLTEAAKKRSKLFLDMEECFLAEGNGTADQITIVCLALEPGRYARLAVGWPAAAFEGIGVRRVMSGGCTGPHIASDTQYYCVNRSPTLDRHIFIGRIPYAPIPTGLSVNIIFYSACAWTLLFGLARARRFVRLKYGSCPHCRYPIGVSPACTECGRKLPERFVQPLKAQTSANPDPS